MKILVLVIGWVVFEVLSKLIAGVISVPLTLLGVLEMEPSLMLFATKLMILNGLSSFLAFATVFWLILAFDVRI